MRDSMIFYRSFYEAIRHLNNNEQAIIYNAIFSYGLDFTEPELDGVTKTIWTLIKPQIDANIKRFNNGKQPKTKQIKSKIKAKNKQTKIKSEANNNVNNNVNDNVNLNDKLSFDIFWNNYDKKVDSSKCFKAWLKLVKECEREFVQKQALKYAESTPDVKFRKNPLTWLNGQCWNDETLIDKPKKIHAFHPIIFD